MKNLLAFTIVVGALLGSAAALQAAAPAPATGWNTSAALGLSVTKGNSDTVLFTANIKTGRKWGQNELAMGADAAYGENSGVKNTESYHAFVQYNRLFSERCYGYGRADFLHDSIANLNYRVALSPGVGYYFIKDAKTSLSAEAGPGFIFERLGGVNMSYVSLRLAERFEHKFTDRTRMWQSFEYLPQLENFSNYIINFEIGLETDLTDKMSLRTALLDTFDNIPAPGRKKNDLKLITSIAYKF